MQVPSLKVEAWEYQNFSGIILIKLNTFCPFLIIFCLKQVALPLQLKAVIGAVVSNV